MNDNPLARQGVNTNMYERQGMHNNTTGGNNFNSYERQDMSSNAGTNMNAFETQATTGEHPTTVDDISTQQNIPTSQHHTTTAATSIPMGSNVSGIHPTDTHDISRGLDRRDDNISNVSSTRSEYGSDDTSHRSPHVGKQQRPVADRDAFIQPEDTQQYVQNNMNPAERAKELADEMKHNAKRSASNDEKILRIGGQKEFNLH